MRHANQQLLEQQIELIRIGTQIDDVIVESGNLMHGHAPLDTAMQGVGLVLRKITAATFAQQDDDFFQGVDDLVRLG